MSMSTCARSTRPVELMDIVFIRVLLTIASNLNVHPGFSESQLFSEVHAGRRKVWRREFPRIDEHLQPLENHSPEMQLDFFTFEDTSNASECLV